MRYYYLSFPLGRREILSPALFSEIAQTSPNAVTESDINTALMFLPSKYMYSFHDLVNYLGCGNKTTYNFFVRVLISKSILPCAPTPLR